MRITDYHRSAVARHYGRLLRRFGKESLLRHMPSKIVWTQEGLEEVERHLKWIPREKAKSID